MPGTTREQNPRGEIDARIPLVRRVTCFGMAVNVAIAAAKAAATIFMAAVNYAAARCECRINGGGGNGSRR